jgi:hypothetical protein
VPHHDLAIGGEVEVELQGRHSEVESSLEGREGVLGLEAAGAPVTLDVEIGD